MRLYGLDGWSISNGYWTGRVVHYWTGRVVHSGLEGWSGILFFSDVVLWAILLLVWRAVPAIEVAGRSLPRIRHFSQAPVRSLATAFDTEVTRSDQNDEAIVLKLTKPAADAVPVAV